MKMFSALLFQLVLIGGAFSHSWIACTDYLEENGDFWDEELCRGFARHGWQYTPKNEFGKDTGYNYNSVPDNKPCKTERDDGSAYNSEYPMAVYYSGQKVVIAHPTKNHVADLCTNRYIPDHGNFVYRSGVNPSADPTLSAFKQNQVVDLGSAPFGHEITDEVLTFYPKPGKQNAPMFCAGGDMDKALATSAFYITPGLQPGRYTFLWSWGFNSDSFGDTYTSCWEAEVVGTKAERNSVLLSNGYTNHADPVLLHGISLAPVPDGVTTQTTPSQETTTQPPTTQETTTQPPTTQETTTQPPTTQETTTQPPTTQETTEQPTAAQTTTPTCGGILSDLVCLDSCLKTCYTNA